MYRILTLNHISQKGLSEFKELHYHLSNDCANPDAILVRSADLHDVALPESLLAIGRAGAGTNNIPIETCSKRGIPVFNTPGANANAVKELVIAALLIASRHVCQAWAFAHSVPHDMDEYDQYIENQKKQFAGMELPGKVLGVIGLGHIGLQVANAGIRLGMHVVGYDPAMTVRHAWQLSSDVILADDMEEVLSTADFLTLHVPFNKHTKHLMNAQRLKKLKPHTVLLNFAREGIVDNEALIQELKEERVAQYICDFPNPQFKGINNVICLPHLGASTKEAEENCAVMIAQEIQEYLEKGTIHNSVNFPSVKLTRTEGQRLCIANRNIPNMVAQICSVLSDHHLNIIDMINKSRDDIAYTLIDVDGKIETDIVVQLMKIDGVLKVRPIV